IGYWKRDYALLTGTPVVAQSEGRSTPETLAVGRILSPIMAAKEGFGLLQSPPATEARLRELGRREGLRLDLIPAEWNAMAIRLRERQSAGRFSACQYMNGMKPELGLAAMVLAAAPAEGDDKKDDKDKKKEDEIKLPEEFLGQMIKEVVMHEVGHSLGLRHNFKASTMLTAEQLNDTSITRTKGMVGSVMDYNPINIAPKGAKQGDYTTTTIGPYDYWAIEYAYKPIDGKEEEELAKIAARSPEPDLVFGTDEDMFLNNDPLVNTYDLGSDTLRFAKDRIALATELLKDLDDRVVRDGDSFARVRDAFSVLLNQWGNGAYLVASHVGGQSVSRDVKGKGARDPITPVPAAKQRESLKFLVEQILSDKAFRFSPALLRRLGSEKWYDWGSGGMSGGVDYAINEEILGIQKIAMNQCLSADVLSRLQNQELQIDAGASPLRVAEVFRTLTDGVWTELSDKDHAPEKALAISTIRRNLQREHLRRLSAIVLGSRGSSLNEAFSYVLFSNRSGYPADARSLARMHLKEIGQKIRERLDQKEPAIDDTTRAHLEECQFRIGKVLDAGLQSNEP
ncbi:MAG: zinc-dependent metalloprotease, partial [Isosphaeraceae bacterium]